MFDDKILELNNNSNNILNQQSALRKKRDEKKNEISRLKNEQNKMMKFYDILVMSLLSLGYIMILPICLYSFIPFFGNMCAAATGVLAKSLYLFVGIFTSGLILFGVPKILGLFSKNISKKIKMRVIKGKKYRAMENSINIKSNEIEMISEEINKLEKKYFDTVIEKSRYNAISNISKTGIKSIVRDDDYTVKRDYVKIRKKQD